jgi:hypothetical protein
MNIISKELIPDKEWILVENNKKIGSVSKSKRGYSLLKNGKKVNYKSIDHLGIELPKKESTSKIEHSQQYQIYNFPCSSRPYEPIFNIIKKLPIFTKSKKSQSHFCAGFYIIKFRKGWVKSFCPKLITLERYSYHGPFRTEHDMKRELNKINKL